MSRLRPLIVFGTRPEAIKLAPVVLACRGREAEIEPTVCSAGQHSELLQQVVDHFDLRPDVHLDLMRPNQSLPDLTARALEELSRLLDEARPDCVVAQGDTTTVLAASMAAFYQDVPFAHVEAGLRTGDLAAPWPEEWNRRIVTLGAAIHFAPTERAAENLLAEGIAPERVHVTGNPVIDALLWTLEQERDEERWRQRYDVPGTRRMVLVTGHRRENFGPRLERICDAIRTLAERFPDVAFVYPIHPNPNVQKPVAERLAEVENAYCVPPAPYPEFVWLMNRATLILTDSGGVQEEAPSLGKPVLVTRETTERPEAVEAGTAELVGASPETIVQRVATLLTDAHAYAQRQARTNPYGDGQAALRIVDLLLQPEWRQRPAEEET